MPVSTQTQPIERKQAERRRQIRGLTLLVIAVLAFSLLRAHLHTVFTPGWWRLW